MKARIKALVRETINEWALPTIVALLLLVTIGSCTYINSKFPRVTWEAETTCWKTLDVSCLRANECNLEPSVDGCRMRLRHEKAVRDSCANPALNTKIKEMLQCQEELLTMQCREGLPAVCRDLPSAPWKTEHE